MTTQFLPWKEQVAAWTDAARLFAEQTRTRCEQLPGEIVEEIRRRINVLDLATRNDVESVTKLGRSRVSFVLKEFLEAQQGRDEALLRSVRSEIREQLESFAAVIDDDVFAAVPPPNPAGRSPESPPAEIDFLDDDESDDEDDLVDYYGMRLTDEDDDEDDFDLADGMGRPTA